jgi:hypothetical protein
MKGVLLEGYSRISVAYGGSYLEGRGKLALEFFLVLIARLLALAC